MARLYLPPAGTRLSTGWDVPKLLLGELLALPQAVIMVNFNTGGGPKEDRQVDLAILTPRALHVVEIKNYRNPVIAPPNGHWFVIRKNGERVPIVNRRGEEQESPVVQAQRNAQALRKALQRYVQWPRLPIYSYVLFPYLHRDSQINSRVVEGVIICKSIEDFLNALVYNEKRSSPHIPPHVLEILPQALGLEDKTQDFKVGGTVLYRIWQRKGMSEAPVLPKAPASGRGASLRANEVWRDIRASLPLPAVGMFVLGLLAPYTVAQSVGLWVHARGLDKLPEHQGAFMFGAFLAPMLVGAVLGRGHRWRVVRWLFVGVLGLGLLILLTLTAMVSKGWAFSGLALFGGLSIFLAWRFPRLRPFFYGWALAWPWLLFSS